MDPMTIAAAFATVLSLVGQFRTELAGREGSDYEQFMVWLTDRNQGEVRALLERDAQTTAGVRALLEQQQEVVLQKLELLDKTLASLASGHPAFRTIAQALRRDSVLSTQAWSILRQFEVSGASQLVVVTSFDGIDLVLNGGGHVTVEDSRFVEDDLKTLADVGLLRRGHTARGDDLYEYTRAASAMVRHVDGPT